MIDQKPFEGDTYIPAAIEMLKETLGLKVCVETGTQYGTTTKWLAALFEKVITIEADPEYLQIANATLADMNVRLIHGRSEEMLPDIQVDRVLYYLDAHGCKVGGCPLKKELQIIASKKHELVCIAIHDFKVPGRDFGFDTYDYELSLPEISAELDKIYPGGYGYLYNRRADGARRGIIYIYPQPK